jgi:hypothetical protein
MDKFLKDTTKQFNNVIGSIFNKKKKKVESLTNNIPQAVIIGGGPVGLWTAISLKQVDPLIEITIYEKYKEYQRNNLICIPKKTEIETSFSQTNYDFFKNKTVQILEVEKTLEKEAIKLGVNIIYEVVEEFYELYNKHPDNKLWIAADGAHSKTRLLWTKSDSIRTNLSFVMQVTYKVKDNAKKLSQIQNFVNINNLHILVEDVPKEDKVTIRFSINEDMYNLINKYTAKEPCTDLDEVTEELGIKSMINYWMEVRKQELNEERIENSFRMNTFKIDIYCSAKYVIENTFGIHVLVGDSAFGVPYYRSLRNGWVASNNLVSLLKEDFKGFVNNYEKYMKDFYRNEAKRAGKITDKIVFVKNVLNIGKIIDDFNEYIIKKRNKTLKDIRAPFDALLLEPWS